VRKVNVFALKFTSVVQNLPLNRGKLVVGSLVTLMWKERLSLEPVQEREEFPQEDKQYA